MEMGGFYNVGMVGVNYVEFVSLLIGWLAGWLVVCMYAVWVWIEKECLRNEWDGAGMSPGPCLSHTWRYRYSMYPRDPSLVLISLTCIPR